MAIHLPETTASTAESLTPRQIVVELDKHVVGQVRAKRAVAIALRNRMRRQKLPADMAEEGAPENILMIGPAGGPGGPAGRPAPPPPPPPLPRASEYDEQAAAVREQAQRTREKLREQL